MKEALLSIIKDENRIITGQIDPQYLSDNLGRKKGTAEAVVFPVSTEEISGVMRYAWKNNLPVTPRGAGTNLVAPLYRQVTGLCWMCLCESYP